MGLERDPVSQPRRPPAGDSPNRGADRGRFSSQGYRTAADGTELFYRYWQARAEQAACLYLHGLGAHGGWFESLAAILSDQGISVLAPDLRGHGRTRWRLGEMPGPSVLRDDACRWLDRLGAANSAPALFVAGTSLGGCLAAAAAEGREDLAGVVLLSPAFRPIYLGWVEQAVLAGSLVLRPRRGVRTPLARGLRLCADERRLTELARDPLSLNELTARSHWNASRLIRSARAALPGIRAPLLCVQGARDPVVDPRANRKLFEDRSGTRFLLLSEGYHDLSLDCPGSPLAAILGEWIASPHPGRRLER